MKWGTLALLEISHSRGCYLMFAVLLVQRVCSPKWPNTKEPRALCPGGLYSWWHFTLPANGSGSHDCAPVMWAYGVPCPAMVSSNAGLGKEDKLLYPDHHLIGCVESGFRPMQKALQQHQQVHSDMVFTCDVCQKEFKTKGYLQQHFRIHDKNFLACCGEKCKNPSDRRKHQKDCGKCDAHKRKLHAAAS